MRLSNLNTKYLGKENEYFDVIDSTQSEVWRKYEAGAKNGYLVFSGIQTAGQGTHGRKWYTDFDGNVAFSLLILPNCNVDKLDGITYKIAEIIIDILKEKYGISLEIKKPNDIVYKGKKIGGILTQSKLEGKFVKALVIGIGINTLQMEFKKDICNIASSIKKEFGVVINKEEFISDFCNSFEKYIENKFYVEGNV